MTTKPRSASAGPPWWLVAIFIPCAIFFFALIWSLSSPPDAATRQKNLIDRCETIALVADYLASHTSAKLHAEGNNSTNHPLRCVITPVNGPQISFPYSN